MCDVSTISKISEDTNLSGLDIPTKSVDKEFDREIKTGYLNLLNSSNINSYKYYKTLNKKFENEVGDFLKNVTINPRLYSNDIRHQYVSAIYARNLGAEKAKWLGNFNERVSIGSGSGLYDSKIDKINNEIGIMYAQKYPNISRNELLEILWRDYPKTFEYSRMKIKN